jgi:hypothetical protein
LGFVLGAVVWCGPLYSLEIAQVAAGRVALPLWHPIYAHHITVLSPFLVQIPAALLWLGVPEYVLCVVMSGLVAALAFAAISVCAWAFSRDRVLTMTAPLLFLAFDLAGHKYPLTFPAGPNDPGIAGFFAALLAVGLASLGPSRAAVLSLGLLPSVHPTIAFAVWLGCASAFIFAGSTERRAWLAQWPWLLAGLSMLVVGWLLKMMLARPPAEFLPASDSTITAMVSSIMLHFDDHRQPLGLWTERWRMLPFFEIDLYWIIFISALAWIGKSNAPAKFFLRASLAWTAVAALFTVIDEASPTFLPVMLKTLMISRWLNLNVPLFIIGVLSLLSAIIRERAQSVATGALIVVVSGLAFGFITQPTGLDADWRGSANSLSWHLPDLAFPIAAVLALTVLALKSRTESVPPRSAPRLVAAGALVVASIIVLGRAVHAHGLSSWSVDGILKTKEDRIVFTAMRSGHGLIVVPPWTATWAQLQTRRGMLPDAELIDVLPYVPRAAPAFQNILEDVYGVSVLSSAGWDAFQNLPSLWLERPTAEWVRIGRTYGATEVLVPATWKLALPEEAQSKNFKLYRIPDE